MKLEKVGNQPCDLPSKCSTKLMLLVGSSHQIKVRGSIVRWDYYRKDPNVSLYVSIWRPAEGDKFELVDYNELTPGVIDFQACDVPEDDQIAVQPGDVIGIFHSKYCITGALAVESRSTLNSNEETTLNTASTMINPTNKSVVTSPAPARTENNSGEEQEPDLTPWLPALEKQSPERVVIVERFEEDISPGDTIDLTTDNHEDHQLIISIQANIRVQEKV